MKIADRQASKAMDRLSRFNNVMSLTAKSIILSSIHLSFITQVPIMITRARGKKTRAWDGLTAVEGEPPLHTVCNSFFLANENVIAFILFLTVNYDDATIHYMTSCASWYSGSFFCWWRKTDRTLMVVIQVRRIQLSGLASRHLKLVPKRTVNWALHS